MNKPKMTKRKDLFSRDELLGSIDKAFTLGDSEIIAEKMIDFILKLVMNKSRLRWVESLMDEFIIDKTFNVFTNIVNMEYSTKLPDEDKISAIKNVDEYKIYENYISLDARSLFEVQKPKIDAWACNKAKVMIVKPGEIPALNPQDNSPDGNMTHLTHTSFYKGLITNASNHSMQVQNNQKSIRQILPAIKKEKANQRYSGINEGGNSLYLDKNSDYSSFNRTSNIGSQLLANRTNTGTNNQPTNESGKIKNKKNVDYGFSANKKEEEEMDQYTLEDDDDNKEPADELELVKLRTLRIYFRERELERERKKKLEMEMEEKNNEDDKRKKKLMEEMGKKPFSYDFEGKIMNVRPLEAEKLYYPPAASTNIAEKQTILSEEGRREREREKEKGKKKGRRGAELKKKDNNYNPEEEFQYSPRYYQPDPLTSHEITPGVVMDFYGVKKEGGKFQDIPGRLSLEDFYTLLAMYKPTNKFISYENPDIKRRDRIKQENIDKIAEADEKFEKESMNLERIFSEESSDEEGQKNLAQQKKEDIIKRKLAKTTQNHGHTHTKQALYEIRKKQKADKIRAMKEFQLDKLNQIDDEKLYDIFNIYDDKEALSVIRKKSVIKPAKVHVSAEKELGVMKKYPRERVAKDILAISGKIKNTTTNTYTKGDPNSISQKELISKTKKGAGNMKNTNINLTTNNSINTTEQNPFAIFR